MDRLTISLAALLAASCGSQPTANETANQVETSGKQEVAVADLPAEVLAVALERIPDLKVAEAEAETRDGRRYYDIGGKRGDGSEVELDIMEDRGRWRVVETQRDIVFAAAPQPVRDAALARVSTLEPTRVIESRQEDGVVIYELYAPAGGNPQGRKVEVKWDGREASLLTREWAH